MFRKLRNNIANWLKADDNVQTPNQKKAESLLTCYNDLTTIIAVEEKDADFTEVSDALVKQYGANFDKDELKAVFAQQFKQHLEDKLKGKTKALKRML